MVLVFSLAAYAGAIALKYAMQIPTIDYVINSGPVALGAYYGIQTMIFEVGLAFLIAWIALRYNVLSRKDCEGYASGLAFWENAGLLGFLSIINLCALYSLLSSDTLVAQQLYEQLTASSPELFASNSEVLGVVAISVFERISSAILHFAWGYLCFMAAYHHKSRLFLIALPMGLIDFLVPFAGNSLRSLIIFELVIFVFAVLSLLVAWRVTKNLRNQQTANTETPLTANTPTSPTTINNKTDTVNTTTDISNL
ncbi:MAG: YhfC family glutamic-type intramembrane protease [Candidatus Bathyarchaeota archaeon]|nr:YhfC family glutamic-type intramembrane protease [Candidatus Termiticorpusculum sp.]